MTAYGNFIRANNTKSLFIGKNFTFDKRLGEPISSDVVSKCHQCKTILCDTYTNCKNRRCNLLFLQCSKCQEKYHNTCGNNDCINVVINEKEFESQPTEIERLKRGEGRKRDVLRALSPVRWQNYRMRIRPKDILNS